MDNKYLTLEDRDYIKQILLRHKDLLETMSHKVWGEDKDFIWNEIVYIDSVVDRLM